VDDFLAGPANRFDVPAYTLDRVAGGKRCKEQSSDQNGAGSTHEAQAPLRV
jgi:hypothetical protein